MVVRLPTVCQGSNPLPFMRDSLYKDDGSGRLPRALLSCFGKKVGKEADQGEALS